MSDEVFQAVRRLEVVGKEWDRKNNKEFMRQYNKKYYNEARLECIKKYGGCAHCGSRDPSSQYSVVDTDMRSVGRVMTWPMLRHRGYPGEYRVYCRDCLRLVKGR